jgi:hypothetical protein
MSKLAARPLSLTIALVVTLAMALVSGSAATAGRTQSTIAPSAATAAPATQSSTVAHNAKGKMTARVVGTTANGRAVTGKFYPLQFSKKDGKIRVRGLINGVVHNFDGTTSTFSALRTVRVKSINGVPVTLGKTTAEALAVCDILHLVLGPLDLDLLGLQVHLDKIVLDIVANPGPGNLLGNLLCAITGLLDEGPAGLLGRITAILNQILDLLRLGV